MSELYRETIPCRLCGRPTPMTGTQLCDRCWELESRIRGDTELAKKIFEDIKDRKLHELSEEIYDICNDGGESVSTATDEVYQLLKKLQQEKGM